MSQWPGTLNQNSTNSRGRPHLNPSSSFEAPLKSKSKSPFRTMNTVSYSEAEPKYSDLARQKLEAGKYSHRQASRDPKRDIDSTSTPRMPKAGDSRKHSRGVSLTEEDNYYGNFPHQGSYMHSDLSPNSSNMLSLDDRDPRNGLLKMRKMRQKSQEHGGRGDSVSSNSRFEEFMQNLQQKKRQISQELESQQEVSPVYPVYPGMQQEDSIYKDENTLQLSNVRMEDIFKRRGSPYTVTNDKMLFFEDEVGNHSNPFGDGNTEKLSAQQIFHENMAMLNKKSNLGSRIEEEEEFGKRDGIHNSSFGDDLSLNPSFLKDEGPAGKGNAKSGAGFGENPFQAKSYVNTELEVELLKAKKEAILLENRMQEKDNEMDELKSALEEAQVEMIKMHELRDREMKRMRQMEEEFLQQKSINKTIEQELSQTLQLQPLQKQFENEGNETIQGLESYQMIRLLKQDRAFLRRRVEECEREVDMQKQRNENLRRELTQVHDKELQKSPINNEAEQILASYAQEIETLRVMNQKSDRRAEELLREIEQRESRFEKDFETERKKLLLAKKEIEKLVEEKDKVDNAMREVQVQQKIRTATFKVEMDKVRELMTELSRENQNYRKEIKVLSKNQNLKEKIEYLESYYKQQLRNVLKENDALQKKVKKFEEEKKPEEEIRLPRSRRMTEDVSEMESEQQQQNKMVKTQRKVSKADQFSSFESQKETVRNQQGNNKVVNQDIVQLRSQLEEAEAEIERLKKMEEDYVKEIEGLRELLEDMRSEKRDVEKRIADEYKEKLKAANQEIDNLKVANTIMASKETNTKVSEYRKQSEKHQEELRALRKTMKQKLDEAQEENIVNKANNENLKRLVQDQEETTRDYQDKMTKEMNSLREEVKEYKRQLEEKQKEVEVLKQKANSRKNTVSAKEVNPGDETLMEELERHRTIVDKQKDMINRYGSENKEFKKVIQEQESHLVQVEAERDQLQSKVKQNEDEMKRFQKKIDELVVQVVQMEEKHQELVKQNKALRGK